MENTTLLQKPEPPNYLRWAILIIASFAMFGNYYIFDSISPVADLLTKELGFSDKNIGTMYSIYSLPNLVMVLVGGIIIDKLGTRISTFVFTLLCVIGAGLTALKGDLYTMAAGRLIFGLGAESMIVAITTVIARYFKGKQLAFAFGVNITIARAGSIAALNSPSWASSLYDGWQGPLLLAFVVALSALVAAGIYWMMDASASRKYSVGESGEQDKVKFSELFSFSKSYWILVFLCLTFYSAIFPFKPFAVKLFMELHGTTREYGGFLLSTLDIAAMILTPVFGLLADYYGKRSWMMTLGSIVLLPVYLLIAYSQIPLIIIMGMMGLAFSMIPAIIWPSVAMIVEEKRLGTAYGVMTMIQATGLTVIPTLIGWVNDSSGGYTAGMWIFSVLGFMGLAFAYWLRRVETGPNGHGLEKGMKTNG